MYTHLLLISTVQIPRAYCSFSIIIYLLYQNKCFCDFLWIWADMLECAIHPITYRTPLKNCFSYYIQCLKVDWCTLFFVNLYAKRTFSVAFLTIDIHANLITLFSALATFMSLSILLSNVTSPFNNSSRLKSYNSLILIMLTISGSDFPVSLN